MNQDTGWKEFFADNGRYADLINGIVFTGSPVVSETDLQELDTQTGFFRSHRLQTGRPAGGRKSGLRKRNRIRDAIRKAAFGVNFAVIGIENQKTIDYSIPLRSLAYDVGEYEKQAAGIRKQVRKQAGGLGAGEYLYGFRKDSRLHPVVTFILYSGETAWDGPESLHGMLDFADMPEELRRVTPDYRINLIEIRKWKDTGVFRTDIRQVFDFIRCAEDEKELLALVNQDPYYQEMEEDAFDVVTCCTNAQELIGKKDYYRKDGRIDMCTAIRKIMEESMEKGLSEGRSLGMDEKTERIVGNMLRRGMPDEDIMAIAECGQKMIDEVRKKRVWSDKKGV